MVRTTLAAVSYVSVGLTINTMMETKSVDNFILPL